ncbi:hypothetical protein Tco_1399441 [Tanacetum coccineum]
MDTAYGRRWIRRIGNCEYAFSCEDLALIRRISFPGYGVLYDGGVELLLGSSNKTNGRRDIFNQSMYIKEMLKKFGLEDSKPTKTPMSKEIKLTKDDEADFVDSTKYREQDIPPPTITAMKIPIIGKGEYDIWSMRMRQYTCHTDHNLWDVIVNGDLEEEPGPT